MRVLAVLACAALLLAPAAGARAQGPERPPESYDIPDRIFQLEKEVLDLRNRVQALQQRLDAVLGAEPAGRVQDIPLGDSPVRGNPTAPITLVEFGDYQSDYTARAQYVVNQLLDDYPEQLRVVFKHYPLVALHPLANEAALTAIAADRQGLFWEMHDVLLRNSRRLEASLLLVLAQQVGLELTQFEADRNSLWALERLSADEKVAARLGVQGVPVFFLNGRRMETWRYDFLKAEIDKLLPGRS